MARLFSSSFGLNSTTNGVEWGSFNAGTGLSIVTSPVRSGAYAARVLAPTGAAAARTDFATSNQLGLFYFRVYIRLAAFPTLPTVVFAVGDVSSNRKVAIQLQPTGAIRLVNYEDAAGVNADSNPLALNTWYRVELMVDTTTLATTAVDARLDGVSFSSGTIDLAAGIARLLVGADGADVTFDVAFDDVAINDATGSYQNTWPGDEQLLVLRPNAAGDNSQWDGDDGTVDPASPHLYIDEITPDDATSFLRSRTTNEITDVNVEDGGLTNEAITFVAVCFRANRSTGTSSSSLVARLKASAGGTVTEGSAETASSTSWRTNDLDTGNATPITLVSYTKPGGSDPWTPADIDAMQIGIRCSTGSGDRYVQVTALWVLVGYAPTEYALVIPGVQSINGPMIV